MLQAFSKLLEGALKAAGFGSVTARHLMRDKTLKRTMQAFADMLKADLRRPVARFITGNPLLGAHAAQAFCHTLKLLKGAGCGMVASGLRRRVC